MTHEQWRAWRASALDGAPGVTPETDRRINAWCRACEEARSAERVRREERARVRQRAFWGILVVVSLLTLGYSFGRDISGAAAPKLAEIGVAAATLLVFAVAMYTSAGPRPPRGP